MKGCGYSCDKPKYRSYYSCVTWPVSYGPDFPYGFFCTNCKEPYMYSVHFVEANPDLYAKIDLKTFIDRKRVKV